MNSCYCFKINICFFLFSNNTIHYEWSHCITLYTPMFHHNSFFVWKHLYCNVLFKRETIPYSFPLPYVFHGLYTLFHIVLISLFDQHNLFSFYSLFSYYYVQNHQKVSFRAINWIEYAEERVLATWSRCGTHVVSLGQMTGDDSAIESVYTGLMGIAFPNNQRLNEQF